MEIRNKILIVVGIILLVLMISVGVYFSWFYEPKNAYDVVWDNKEDTSMEVKEVGKKIVNEPKESKLEEVKKEPTLEEIIREVERAKPRFNLNIQPNLVAEYKDYAELEEAAIEKVVNTLKSDGEKYPKTVELAEEDIKRLQAYDTPEVGAYIGFKEYYNDYKDDAQAWIKDISPVSFPYYKNAKVEWLTSPELVYRNAIGKRGIRGILRLQYFEEENRFKVEANKIYELDIEIVISNTDNDDNTTSLKLNKILYLSNLREVE